MWNDVLFWAEITNLGKKEKHYKSFGISYPAHIQIQQFTMEFYSWQFYVRLLFVIVLQNQFILIVVLRLS